MLIGILQTGHSPEGLIEDYGDYGDMFVKLLDGNGFSFRIWSVVDGDFPASAREADGWLITGSRHGAYEDLAFIPPLEGLIREIYTAGIPLVGVCFGHQIIAQALGGKVEKYSGGWSVGATEYLLADGRQIALNAWHQDQVTERPEGAEVLASSPFCENAILAYGDRAYTVQAHPEFTAGFVKGLIDTRGRGKVPDALLDQADNRLTQPLANSGIAASMAEFFKKPRG